MNLARDFIAKNAIENNIIAQKIMKSTIYTDSIFEMYNKLLQVLQTTAPKELFYKIEVTLYDIEIWFELDVKLKAKEIPFNFIHKMYNKEKGCFEIRASLLEYIRTANKMFLYDFRKKEVFEITNIIKSDRKNYKLQLTTGFFEDFDENLFSKYLILDGSNLLPILSHNRIEAVDERMTATQLQNTNYSIRYDQHTAFKKTAKSLSYKFDDVLYVGSAFLVIGSESLDVMVTMETLTTITKEIATFDSYKLCFVGFLQKKSE